MRVVSINVLAPELLMYFWRSSYGLAIKQTSAEGVDAYFPTMYYDGVNQRRFRVIVEYLKSLSPDVVCLQETTNQVYGYLDNLSIAKFIARELGMLVVSEAFKQSDFKYNYPPEEQRQRYGVKTGVATLASLSTTTDRQNIGTWNEFSPMVLDRINGVLVVNVHIAMNYPSIDRGMRELQRFMTDSIGVEGMKMAIGIGDFNAQTTEAATDMVAAPINHFMKDFQGTERVNDHLLVGRNVVGSIRHVSFDYALPLLTMKWNAPASSARKWGSRDVDYTLSPDNNALADTGRATTDHEPVIVDLDPQLYQGAKGDSARFRQSAEF